MLLCVLSCYLLLLTEYSTGEFNPLFKFQSNIGHVKTVEVFDSSATLEVQHPIHVYGTPVKSITIYRNGWIRLGEDVGQTPSPNYPDGSAHSRDRIQDFNGRYLAIFTSVNHGGHVTARDLSLTDRSILSCLGRLQLKRFVQLIHLRNSNDRQFEPKSMVVIAWQNMTNSECHKSNSYALIILSNETTSYAVIQYWKIGWPEASQTVSEALPPEAGVFVRPNEGFHLPRSGHSVDASQWLSESNVAVPGEWLIPLHEASVDSTSTVERLSKITAKHLSIVKTTCAQDLILRNVTIKSGNQSGFFVNDSPTMSYPELVTDIVDVDPYSYIDEEDFDYDNDFWGDYDEMETDDDLATVSKSSEALEYGSVQDDEQTDQPVTELPKIVTETVVPLGLYDGDEERFNTIEPNIVPESFIPLEEDAETRTESMEMITMSQSHDTHFYTETRSYQSEGKCDASKQCADPNSECQTVQGEACCICKEGFYGSGNSRCWPDAGDENFAFRGTLKAEIGQASFELPIYLDIQNGRSKRSSSGVRNGHSTDPNFQAIRLLTPMFHLLNAMIATTCEQDSTREESRAFNVFSFSGALRSTFNIQFYFDIDHVGRLSANVNLRLDQTSQEPYSRGKIDVQLTAPEGLQEIKRVYREHFNAGETLNRTYYSRYHMDQYRRVIFPEQSVKFVAESRGENQQEAYLDELNVRWSAVAMLRPEHNEDAQADCMLQIQSRETSQEQMNYIKMLDRGYCSEDCSAVDGSCNLFCIDVPLLFSKEPDACSCVTCSGFGEYCKPEGTSYTCECQPGLRRMDDHTCRGDAEKSGAVITPREPCGMVQCHENARCIDQQQGICQCLPGYRGDGMDFCEHDPCARCQRNEICENDQCKPTGVDLCEGIRCGVQAFCRDGACVCTPGYTGDPMVECIEERELCAGVQCHRFAQCYENRCYCSHGYVGDGLNFCDVHTEDPCDGIRCAANGECRDGRCSCLPGYEGDGYYECRMKEDRCANVVCHSYAQCQDGQCRCIDGYEGDGYSDCRPADTCSQVRCHPEAECRDGRCSCRPGYEGDGYYDCRRATYDPCDGVQCHAYARCEAGYCRCSEGYEGDGYYECRPMSRCIDSNCHPSARCVNDRCQCKAGYEGDGYTNCQRKPGVDPSECGKCRGVPLREMAQCVDGQCVCAPGFIMTHPGVCIECVQDNCHQDATCLPTAEFNGAFSCQCKAGYHGNGVTSCVPVGTSVDPTCGGGCRVPNAECNPNTGRCECRRGYEGDGHYHCTWNCQLCVPEAICDKENERCSCKPGYHGDGTMFCDLIPTRPDPVKVHIVGQGDVMRIADLDKPIVLRCLVTTTDDSVTGQWVQPTASQAAHISMNRLIDGTENVLRIEKPSLADAGRYYCRAGGVEAFIDVAIEETAVPFDIFLTSDDGILKIRSSGKNVTMATIWNLAENNKYGRIAMTTDCNNHRVIYTSDYGHAIRSGDANAKQKELTTSALFQSQVNRFRSLAVDPPSGNIFAWDESYGKLVVLNPNKPHMKYTLENIESFKRAEPLRFAGITLNSNKGLMYWAAFTDGWMPNGTIQVATMAGQNERQLLQLNGEPLAISLSPSYDNTDYSAGRLCWIQRSLNNIFALTTEMHCARLSEDGLSIIKQERLRQFDPSEEPSWGMVHHRGSVFWTDASKPVYYSANPDRRVRVRHVCCSNRFQAIAPLAKCDPAMSNVCSYTNGRCRYFCLPDGGSRVCACPDTEPGCHKEM